MKKKLLLFLFMLGSFIFCFSSIKAIDITCGSTTCSSATFSLAQLTSTNTASGKTYNAYASHFQSYYQSTAACVKTSSACTSLASDYSFTMNWSSSGGFSASSSKGFTNLTAALKTSSSYTKAGTYVFLVKQTAATTGVTKDSSEYILYVNVKSDLTIGSAVAKRIKNSSGTAISAEKVTSLSFSLTKPFASKPEAIYNIEGDFYFSNTFASSGYADTSIVTTYVLKLPTTSNVTAKIYNKNGLVKDVTVTNNSDVSLSHGEVLVIPKNTFSLGAEIGVMLYGMQGAGLYANTLNVYKPSVKKSQNGSTSTITSVQSGWASSYNYDSNKGISLTLGGTGENYLEYTWTYDESKVPSTGVIIKVLPYVVMVGAIMAVGVLLVLTKKRKITDITE